MSSEPKIVGYCRACGKALDETTVRNANGTIYCADHVPAPIIDATAQASQTHTAPPYHSPASPYGAGMQPPPLTTPAGQGGSPPLAFLLGMIPGVGAVYNGQYAKGLVHVIIVGALIAILDSGEARSLEPLFGLILAGFWFYMGFEAYHTAKRRRMGQPLDEFSGLAPMGNKTARLPIGPVVLIGVGVLFLLHNLDLLDFHKVARYWPAALIVYGVFLLWTRLQGAPPSDTGAAAVPPPVPPSAEPKADSAESRLS